MALTTAASPVTNINLPAWDPRMTGSLRSTGNKGEDDAKLKKACQEMEAVFLNLLLKTMRATVPKSELGGNTQHTETMQSMMDMEMTRNMAAAGGTGIAAMMYRNLTNPGVANPVAVPVKPAEKTAK
jgi:flagellar protein FlgJ